MSKETRITDPDTGGQKNGKLARFDQLPAGPLYELAEHYGKGSLKYSDSNWRKGYDWKLSFAALQRHLWQFWGGEDLDVETGSKHVIAAAWHCLALAEFMDKFPNKDSRWRANSVTQITVDTKPRAACKYEDKRQLHFDFEGQQLGKLGELNVK